MTPGLGPAEELVAAEGHQGGAGLQRLGDGGLAGQPRGGPPSSHGQAGVEQAGAEVDDEREAGRRPASATATDSVNPVIR